jgi:hypothetical protein
VYVPPESGLGAREIAAMRRLPSGAYSVLAGELGEPGSWPTVRRILRDSDPERALARQMSIEVERAVAAHRSALESGLGDVEVPLPEDGLGNFFKRIGKAIRRHVKQIVDFHKKVIHTVEKVHAKTDLIYKAVRPRPRHPAPPSVAAAASTPDPVSSSSSPIDYMTGSSQIVSAPSGSSSQPSIQYVQEQPPADQTPPTDPTAPAADVTVAPVSAPADATSAPVPESKSSSALLWLLLAGGGAAIAARHKK